MLKNYLGFLVQRNNLGSIVGRKNTFLPCRKICRARTDRHHLFVKGDLWHFVPAGIIWQRSEWFDTFKPYRIWEELLKPFCKNLTRLGPSGPPDWCASPVQWRPPAQSKMQLVRSVVDCIYSWALRRVTSWHCLSRVSLGYMKSMCAKVGEDQFMEIQDFHYKRVSRASLRHCFFPCDVCWLLIWLYVALWIKRLKII